MTKVKSRIDWTPTSGPFQCSVMCLSFPPLDIHQYQLLLINPFWVSHCLSFEPPLRRPTQLHPPATLMVFSHINQLIKSKFQWWINVPGLMRWSASFCYQSTCCQMIVSCWDVRHYEVHSETQLSYKGSNRSKSIFDTVFLECALSWQWTVYPTSCLTCMPRWHLSGKLFSLFIPMDFFSPLQVRCGCIFCIFETALLYTQVHFKEPAEKMLSKSKWLCA